MLIRLPRKRRFSSRCKRGVRYIEGELYYRCFSYCYYAVSFDNCSFLLDLVLSLLPVAIAYLFVFLVYLVLRWYEKTSL